ncbi:hypothetical protein BGZ93_000799 [Podila epicladia]|nr:hypothetical protein BGZ93_000799 [Podila epicladia]
MESNPFPSQQLSTPQNKSPKMFSKTLALVAVLAVAVSAATIPEAASAPQVLQASAYVEAESAAGALEKRGCVYDGCRCNISRGGLACYGNNVYQCSPSGECCNFGYRNSCAQCGKLNC